MHELGGLGRGQAGREERELLVEGGAVELLHAPMDGCFEDGVLHGDGRVCTAQTASPEASVRREHVLVSLDLCQNRALASLSPFLHSLTLNSRLSNLHWTRLTAVRTLLTLLLCLPVHSHSHRLFRQSRTGSPSVASSPLFI